MFRGPTNVILILGILLCPFCCGEGLHPVSAAPASESSNSCCGCGCDHSTDGEQNGRSPCHDGCGRDCVCKGFLAGHAKLLLASVDFWLPIYGEPYVAVPAPLASSPEVARPHNATHPDLCSGAAIRLAFASLLI